MWVKSKDPTKATQALELFNRIEAKSWRDEDKARAKQGRLRAMLALGRAEEAVEQAQKLAEQSEDHEILIEAKNIMAQAAEKDLRNFLEENPRWEMDSNVIEERHRLYNRVLELYLYPALFFGSDAERSACGLWGAAGIYRLSNQTNLAIETARDIVTLYPDSPEATPAKQYLASLKPEELASDFEAEARKELQEGMTKSPDPTPEPTPEPASNKTSKKKSKKT
jgi:tetratricopeptide (TPR) repeat protein